VCGTFAQAALATTVRITDFRMRNWKILRQGSNRAGISTNRTLLAAIQIE
jgi:hypothetical protein